MAEAGNFVLRKKGTNDCLTADRERNTIIDNCDEAILHRPNYTIFRKSDNTLHTIADNPRNKNKSRADYVGSVPYNEYIADIESDVLALDVPTDGSRAKFVIAKKQDPGPYSFVDGVVTVGKMNSDNVISRKFGANKFSNDFLAALKNGLGKVSQSIGLASNGNWNEFINTAINTELTYVPTVLAKKVDSDIYSYKDDPLLGDLYDKDAPRPPFQFFDSTGKPVIPPKRPNRNHKYYQRCEADQYCEKTCMGIPNEECMKKSKISNIYNLGEYDQTIERPAYSYFTNAGITPVNFTGNVKHPYYGACKDDPYCFETCKDTPVSYCNAVATQRIADPREHNFIDHTDLRAFFILNGKQPLSPSNINTMIINYYTNNPTLLAKVRDSWPAAINTYNSDFIYNFLRDPNIVGWSSNLQSQIQSFLSSVTSDFESRLGCWSQFITPCILLSDWSGSSIFIDSAYKNHLSAKGHLTEFIKYINDALAIVTRILNNSSSITGRDYRELCLLWGMAFEQHRNIIYFYGVMSGFMLQELNKLSHAETAFKTYILALPTNTRINNNTTLFNIMLAMSATRRNNQLTIVNIKSMVDSIKNTPFHPTYGIAMLTASITAWNTSFSNEYNNYYNNINPFYKKLTSFLNSSAFIGYNF
jgi:hypothetical protein